MGVRCEHWIGSDTTGRSCNADTDGKYRFCEKHLAIQLRRLGKQRDRDREQRDRAEAKWRDRNVPRLPQWRVSLERAEAEYERRTASAVNDRAAVGGYTHPSIRRRQLASLSDTNVARVAELDRIITKLRADIKRAEAVAS